MSIGARQGVLRDHRYGIAMGAGLNFPPVLQITGWPAAAAMAGAVVAKVCSWLH